MLRICLTGERPATIEDFEVEVLRFAEFDGTFDRCEANITAKQLRLADIRQTDAAKERAVSEPITHAIHDTSRQTLLFVEIFGRITRVMAGIGDFPASEPWLGETLHMGGHVYGEAWQCTKETRIGS